MQAIRECENLKGKLNYDEDQPQDVDYQVLVKLFIKFFKASTELRVEKERLLNEVLEEIEDYVKESKLVEKNYLPLWWLKREVQAIQKK